MTQTQSYEIGDVVEFNRPVRFLPRWLGPVTRGEIILQDGDEYCVRAAERYGFDAPFIITDRDIICKNSGDSKDLELLPYIPPPGFF